MKNQPADYDFVAEDGFGHHFWTISDAAVNKRIEELFATKVPFTYVADGHTAPLLQAELVRKSKLRIQIILENEEYCYFMAVHFPDNQLKIIDYNRVVKDLNRFVERRIYESCY